MNMERNELRRQASAGLGGEPSSVLGFATRLYARASKHKPRGTRARRGGTRRASLDANLWCERCSRRRSGTARSVARWGRCPPPARGGAGRSWSGGAPYPSRGAAPSTRWRHRRSMGSPTHSLSVGSCRAPALRLSGEAGRGSGGPRGVFRRLSVRLFRSRISCGLRSKGA